MGLGRREDERVAEQYLQGGAGLGAEDPEGGKESSAQLRDAKDS